MRILGIAPGISVTGYALLDWSAGGPQIVEAGALHFAGSLDLAHKLASLRDDLLGLIKELAPEILALESLFSHPRFPASAIQAAHARGVVCLCAADAGLPIHDIAPAAVKNSIVGSGSATKEQVQGAVAALYRLSKIPSPPDVADAIGIATAVGYRLRAAGGV